MTGWDPVVGNGTPWSHPSGRRVADLSSGSKAPLHPGGQTVTINPNTPLRRFFVQSALQAYTGFRFFFWPEQPEQIHSRTGIMARRNTTIDTRVRFGRLFRHALRGKHGKATVGIPNQHFNAAVALNTSYENTSTRTMDGCFQATTFFYILQTPK